MRRTHLGYLVIAPLAVAAGFLLCLNLFGPRDPEYGGKSIRHYLNEWNRRYQPTPDPKTRADTQRADGEALEALRGMGLDAVTFLARRLERDEPVWQPYYRRIWPNLPTLIQSHLTRPTPPIASANKVDAQTA